MAIYSKLCARGGCTGHASTEHRRRFDAMRFCSQRCTYLERARLGTWLVSVLTPEARRRGARSAGRIIGERKRKEAVRRAAEGLSAMLPNRLFISLDTRELALVKALMARAYRKGYRTGYQRGYGPRGKQRRAAA